jgi:hypothetical protein
MFSLGNFQDFLATLARTFQKLKERFPREHIQL